MATSTRSQIDTAESLAAFINAQTHLAPVTKENEYYLIRAFLRNCDDIANKTSVLTAFSAIENNNSYNLLRIYIGQYRKFLGLEAIDIKSRRGHSRAVQVTRIKSAYDSIMSGDFRESYRMALLILRWAGIRAGELLGLTPADVEFDESSCILNVNGKTGRRRIRVLEITAKMREYLNSHDIPVTRRIFPIQHNALWKEVQMLCKRYKTSILITPHLLRHLRATEMAKTLREPEMRIYFGWSKNSNMPSVYVHLSGQDCNDHILEIAGIAKAPEKPSSSVCPRCHSPNPPENKFCGLCGQNLAGINLDLQREVRESTTDALIKRLEKLEQELASRFS